MIDWNAVLPTVEDILEVMGELWPFYKNEPSEKFREQWSQNFETARRQVIDFDDEEKRKLFTILSPCTGSGKSLGWRAFSIALWRKTSLEDQPGVRIVVRTTEAAAQLAEDIREMTSPTFAVAWNSAEKRKFRADKPKKGTKPTGAERRGKQKREAALANLANAPVVVTCHRGYEISSGELFLTGEDSAEAAALENYRGHPRRSFLIDECANYIQVARVSQKTLQYLLIDIPLRSGRKAKNRPIRERHLPTIAWIQGLIDRGAGEIFQGDITAPPPGVDILSLRNDMRFVRLGRDQEKKHREYEEALTTLRFFEQHKINRSVNVETGEIAFSSSRKIVPSGARGAVVTDATAQTSKTLYDLFGERVVLVPPVEGIRTYWPVKVFAKWGHNVGKNTMTKESWKMVDIARELRRNLPALAPGETGLLIVHQDLDAHLTGTPATKRAIRNKKKVTTPPKGLPAGWSVTHWGLHDASNTWSEVSKVVIFGLQLLPETWGEDMFNGYEVDPSAETGLEKAAICEALIQEHATVSVIQGASRGACRRVVEIDKDGAGVCPPMEIYILLPGSPLEEGEMGAAVYSGLIGAFPGCRELPWGYDGQRTITKPKEGGTPIEAPKEIDAPHVEAVEVVVLPWRPPVKGTDMLKQLEDLKPGEVIFRKDLQNRSNSTAKEAGCAITRKFRNHAPEVAHLEALGIYEDYFPDDDGSGQVQKRAGFSRRKVAGGENPPESENRGV